MKVIYRIISIPVLVMNMLLLGATDEQVADFSSSNLPILIIDTRGQEIRNDYRITADMGIIYNGPGQRNNLSDPWNNYNGLIDIEYRGSSSLWFPKKPFRVETVDSLGNNRNVSLLGMPRENDWVLHNPFSDKSLLRNVLAYKLSNDIGRYASRTRMCEVVLNNEYQGVYVLMEKIKRDRNRVDIAEIDSNDIAGDSLTGGYILKVDKTDGENVGGWQSDNNIFYQYHFPKPDRIQPQQAAYIQNYIKAFETMISSENYRDSYLDFIDLGSFVDHFILNEISKNIDAYRLSAFMYKDRESLDNRLLMGPIWDFNLSFGNANYYQGDLTSEWNLDHLIAASEFDFPVPFWWEIIRNDEEFLLRLSQRWWTLRSDKFDSDKLMDFIDSMADSLEEAQIRNFEKWPILGEYIWPNAFIGNTYQEEIDFMKDWLLDRIEWMDSMIDLPLSISDESNQPGKLQMAQNYPNPFSGITSIRFEVPVNGNVKLSVYDLFGHEVASLINEYRCAGVYTAEFNAYDLPGGIYIYTLQVGKSVMSKKLMLLK
ncbi:MAG: CotH kinase family protein [Bacteroidales bacterium]|nr:MAG: CotH kinase family protein [Bacteroidales bacterium]